MKTRVAINGFGRIGRMAFRIARDREDLEIVGINDLTDTKTLAYLLAHDSNYGNYHHKVGSDEHSIIVDDVSIPVFAEKDPAALPWADKQVDVVIESTGRFTTAEAASAHLKAGAKKVVISAPAKGEDVKTIVIGANDDELSKAGDVISNASCTTNSIAAIMDIIDREFGIEKAMLTTVHSDTASQTLTDSPAKDLREGRAAPHNIVPTTTGAAKAVALTVPNLAGKFDGLSVRVPTPVVSLSDVTMVLKRATTVDEINDVLKKAAAEPYYQGIVSVSDEPLVSSDYIGNSSSGIVDLALTNVVDGNLAKVVVWYDNEWGYSNRLVELVADVGRMMQTGGSQPAGSAVTAQPEASVTRSEPAAGVESPVATPTADTPPATGPAVESAMPTEPVVSPELTSSAGPVSTPPAQVIEPTSSTPTMPAPSESNPTEEHPTENTPPAEPHVEQP